MRQMDAFPVSYSERFFDSLLSSNVIFLVASVSTMPDVVAVATARISDHTEVFSFFLNTCF